MNSRERLEKCLKGEPVDRPPVALWRHFPIDDLTPHHLARSILLFQNTYHFDFVKITPRSSYSTQDWGSVDSWDGNPEGSGAYTQFPINHPEEWSSLKLHDATSGALGEQLKCIELVRSALPSEIPVIPTIFSPLSQAKHLAGNPTLFKHLRETPDAIHAGLRTIVEQTCLFIRECKKLGIDGIFFAVQYAQKGLLTDEEFRQFGFAYDEMVLAEVQDCWLNVGHIHGSQIMFDIAVQYPVSVLNWHDREEGIPLDYGLAHFKGAVCGGLRQWDTMAYGRPENVRNEAADALRQTQGKRFILGTGCVLPIIAPHSNITAAIESVDQT
jgi:uroporphyrinogen decarboxylase